MGHGEWKRNMLKGEDGQLPVISKQYAMNKSQIWNWEFVI